MKLMIFCGENNYKKSSWYGETLEGLRGAARKRGIPLLLWDEREPESIPEGISGETVVLLGFSGEWIGPMAQYFKKAGARVVLICLDQGGIPDRVHLMELDRARAIREIVGRLAAAGRKHILLFGVDRGSVSDREREEAYLESVAAYSLPVSEKDIYPNVGSLEECLFTLKNKITRYDAAVCANDYAALALLQCLKQWKILVPEEMMVTGCGNMALGEVASPSLTSVTLDYLEAGRQAVDLALYLEKHPEIMSSKITLESRLILRDSTGPLPAAEPTEPCMPSFISSVPFFRDQKVLELAQANDFLLSLDDTDRAIINAFRAGCRSSETADRCFIAQTTFKKRMSRLLNASGTASRTELLEKLLEWGITGNL